MSQRESEILKRVHRESGLKRGLGPRIASPTKDTDQGSQESSRVCVCYREMGMHTCSCQRMRVSRYCSTEERKMNGKGDRLCVSRCHGYALVCLSVGVRLVCLRVCVCVCG